MDRSWIRNSKPGDREYDAGVRQFINFAVKNSEGREKLPCPCHKCHNLLHKRVDEILNHLTKFAFDNTYTCWIWHGEKMDETHVGKPKNSVFEEENVVEGDNLEDMLRVAQDEFNDDPSKFERLLSDSEKPLYPGCKKYSRLKAILKLYNLKAANGLSDKGFGDFLEVFKDMLPEENVLPKRTYEAKKTLSTMGLRYEKIHACPNDCMLYWKEHESLSNCPVCNASRYKKKEGVPAKVLWYFPIIPRFKRLFSNSGDAEKLTWHVNGRKKDGKLRHPADSPQWRFIDAIYRDFSKEERNLRLALSTDGMNPFGSLSSTHSTWPVILVTYNLPPSLYMKRKYMMLSLLISGPKQPGNDICVYLAPLIADLKKLWEQGVEVFDAHRNETFMLRAMLFCTIQDFPAYGNLSGYTVYGESPCPICEDGLKGKWLTASKKNVFLDNRRFLPDDHPYRKRKRSFNGEQEFRGRPKVLTSEEVFKKVEHIHTTFGKKNKASLPKQGYKKCSIFWSLPYWRHLFVRHCLDVMHIEKNVCDSLVGTLLNINGKTKDGQNARDDLKEMGIRNELHPVKKNDKTYLPPACYTLSRREKKEFCESLAGVKVPEGFSSNFSKLVNMETLKLVGLKSHDCHVLMQHLLPIAIRSILPKNVRCAIIRLCSFFHFIYSKVIDLKVLKFWEREIVVILCELEMFFPPSFFDVMIHLTVHLVREVRFCGPVHGRNQYAFERQMKTYKGYVKNPFRPEACIAERLFYEEVIGFSTEYLGKSLTIGLPLSRHSGRMEGQGTIGHRIRDLKYEEWHMAHTYILFNEDEVAPYADQHIAYLRKQHRKASQKSILDEHTNHLALG
ncbi:Protease HtpX-like protein 2 [Bienertia sinuspersici]